LNLNFGSDHLLLHGRVNIKLLQRGQARKKNILQLHRLHMVPHIGHINGREIVQHTPSETALTLSARVLELTQTTRSMAISHLEALAEKEDPSKLDIQQMIDTLDQHITSTLHAAAVPLLEETILSDSQDLGPLEEAAIAERQQCLDTYLANPDSAGWQAYTQQRAETASVLQKRKAAILKEYNDQYPDLYRDNPREFWKRTKTYLRPSRDRKPFPPVEALTEHFKNLFQSDSPTPPLPLPQDDVACSVQKALAMLRAQSNELTDFSSGMLSYKLHARSSARVPSVFFNIATILTNLPNWKSAGKDQLRYEYFKYTSGPSSELLQVLFCLVWTLETVPTSWSESLMCPLFKNKGSPLEPKNYRSISLENSIEKIYSLCLQEHLIRHINPQLADEQFGFRPECGTEDAIFIVNEVLQQHCAQGNPLYMVFVDLAKAFDTVLWPALFRKLSENFQVPAQELHMIALLYNNVQLHLRVNGNVQSTPFTMTRGVRQGNVLSPLLFAVYINDLILSLREHAGVSLSPVRRHFSNNSTTIRSTFYADDFALLANTLSGTYAMLDTVHRWCLANGIALSEKTKWMGVNVPDHLATLQYPPPLMPRSWTCRRCPPSNIWECT
jgi:hypothetical protein